MGAIKDLVDLVDKLNTSVTDRKTRELLLPLKEKATDAQREIFHAERHHAEEMDKLKAEHRDAMTRLEMENAALRAKQAPTPEAKFNPEIGTWFDSSSSIHYCPRCWGGKTQVSPMTVMSSGWQCAVCGFGAVNPSECEFIGPSVVSGPNIIDLIDPDRRHFPR